jgi:DNA-binding protein YbaB
MGIIDTAKMMRKAQQARSQMKGISVVGRSKSGLTALLLNGLNEIEEIEYAEEMDITKMTKKALAKEVIEAFNDARKNLEKELASNFDLNSISDMFN